MTDDVVFPGVVTRGGLKFPNPTVKDAFADHVRALGDGTPVEVIVRKERRTRSDAQRKWLWGVAMKTLAEHFGWDRHQREALHYELLKVCFGTDTDEATGLKIPNVAHSSKLSTAEFSEYSEWVVRWAAQEHGVVIPFPSEQGHRHEHRKSSARNSH